MGQQAYCIVLNVVILFVTHFIVQASTKSLNCTFDDDFCDWTSDYDDDFDWKRGLIGYIGSGFVSDHTTGDGLYIYISAIDQQKGDRARVTSPVQTPGAHCLTLWYNMNNWDLGALNIYVKTVNGRETLIFTTNTHFGSRRWQKAVISRKLNVNFQVVLEGVRGQSSDSDIAVDDISMTDELCSADCNFESGLCDWVQDLSDDFNWRRHQGGTSTPNTGPPGDHTSGRGYYIYIDTSETRRNYNARILSPWLREGKYCFSFWYYMYGEDVGTLTVETGDVYQNKTAIVEKTGAQQQKWIQKNAFIHATSGFQIIIEGTVKNSWWNHDYGDIAIDDVRMLSCQDCADPTPRYGKSNSSSFQYKSKVQIICNLGYSIKGHHIIVCNSEGIWSGSPVCEPVDCSIPKIANGIMSGPRNYTTYNQTVDIACKDGYDLIGNKSITCQADGYWSALPTCDLHECNDPIPENGILNSTRFRYGSAIEITCNDGYRISGKPVIYCQANGNWTSSPTCRLIDCSIPKIANGIMSGPRNYTTYNQTVDIACKDGYDLVGNRSIICQADGYWSAPPTCDLREPVNTSALTAVYVTVPLAVVGLFIALITVIWRKRILRPCVIRGSHEQVKKEQPQPKTLFNNMAYSETFNENQSNQDGDISQDEEYAVIEDDMNELGQGEIPAYYNITDAEVTSIKELEHTYNHTTQSGTLVTDNTYSRLAGDKNMTESNYNTTEFPFSGNTSSQLNTNPRNNNYDVLNTKKTQPRCGIDAQPDMQNEEDSEYDHAQAGGADPKDIDDYSHLNEETEKYRSECSEIKYSMVEKCVYTNTKEQTERATKA